MLQSLRATVKPQYHRHDPDGSILTLRAAKSRERSLLHEPTPKPQAASLRSFAERRRWFRMGNVLQLRDDISGAVGKIIWTARKSQPGATAANSRKNPRPFQVDGDRLNAVCKHALSARRH